MGHILPFFTFYIYKSEIVREVGRPAIPDIVVRFVRFFLARLVSVFQLNEFDWTKFLSEDHQQKEGKQRPVLYR